MAQSDHLDLATAQRLVRGRLDPQTQAHWDQHLASCERCRALVENERAFGAALALGDVGGGAVPEAAAELAPRLPRAWAPPVRRREIVTFAVSLGVCVGLAGLLSWQMWARADPARELAAELHLAPDVQAQIVQQLPALQALRDDPWLADEWESVQALGEFLAERPAGAPPEKR